MFTLINLGQLHILHYHLLSLHDEVLDMLPMKHEITIQNETLCGIYTNWAISARVFTLHLPFLPIATGWLSCRFWLFRDLVALILEARIFCICGRWFRGYCRLWSICTPWFICVSSSGMWGLWYVILPSLWRSQRLRQGLVCDVYVYVVGVICKFEMVWGWLVKPDL